MLATGIAMSVVSSSYATDLDNVSVNGIHVGVYKNAIDKSYVKYIIVVGDRVVSRGEDVSDYVSIDKVYEGDGSTFIVIVETCGGSACGPMFKVLQIVGDRATATPLFGTGLSANSVIVRDGSLVLTMDAENHKTKKSYTVRDGKVQEATEVASIEIGPDVAPGRDLAAFVNGRPIYEVFRMRAAVIPLKRIMPAAVFDEVRQWAFGANAGLTAQGGYVYVSKVCQPHMCGNYVSVAFDHSGQAWAAVAHENNWVFYGNPNPSIKFLLTN